jgi:hypothetical protein
VDGWLASIPPDWWDEHLFTNYRQFGVKTTVPGMFFRFCAILVEDSRTSSDAPYRIPEHAVSVHLGPSLACTLSYLDFLDFHQSSGRKTWNDSE